VWWATVMKGVRTMVMMMMVKKKATMMTMVKGVGGRRTRTKEPSMSCLKVRVGLQAKSPQQMTRWSKVSTPSQPVQAADQSAHQ